MSSRKKNTHFLCAYYENHYFCNVKPLHYGIKPETVNVDVPVIVRSLVIVNVNVIVEQGAVGSGQHTTYW